MFVCRDSQLLPHRNERDAVITGRRSVRTASVGAATAVMEMGAVVIVIVHDDERRGGLLVGARLLARSLTTPRPKLGPCRAASNRELQLAFAFAVLTSSTPAPMPQFINQYDDCPHPQPQSPHHLPASHPTRAIDFSPAVNNHHAHVGNPCSAE